MDLPVLKKIRAFYAEYKEFLLYLFFGGLTFVVSVSSYVFCNLKLGINVLAANIVSWILAVAFAYVTNRIWVFQSKSRSGAAVLREIFSFAGSRIATLILEEIVLFVFITVMNFSSVAVKITAQIVVILSNYLLSKLFVFTRVDKK
ncbi:MAG: GtrA family protein [Synergistaceae bacterium]|nr:GtrA family protein [Synergistaceae bacterium]